MNINSRTILMKFIVRERSKDTFVYKVSAFNYWDNLTQTPNLIEYRGYKYLVYNQTNNRIKAIDEPATPAILENCLTPNMTDPRLQDWQVLISTNDIYAYKHICQIKRTLDFNYVYCFP